MTAYKSFLEEVRGFKIPLPFDINNNKLCKHIEKEGKVEKVEVSRQVPYVTKYFDDIEQNNVKYELKWFSNGRIYTEIVPAITLASRREIIQLANKGFSSNDLNARSLIEYFNKYLDVNRINKAKMIRHIGYGGEDFIHPLISTDYYIEPPDTGEIKLLNSFGQKGSVKEWIDEYFAPIRGYNKAVIPVVASFASVLFEEFKLSPIIIDISGPSSVGKTTAQIIAASVWANHKSYMITFNATDVAIERRAIFLNAFPVILDDTNEVKDPNMLQDIIYRFGNGTGRARGSLEGMRETGKWNSVLISTGENNMLEYTTAQGTAARVIPITNYNLKSYNDKLANFKDGSKELYGTIGIEFLKRWAQRKGEFLPRYSKLVTLFQDYAKGNNIMHRIAKPYAFIVFIAEVLNDLFRDEGMKIPIANLAELFLEICNENNHVDRAKNVLIEILEELEANRNHVYAEYEPANGIHAISNAKGLFLTIDYLKKKLRTDMRQIREAWKNQSLTVSQKNNVKVVDYLSITHKGQSFRVVQVSSDFLKEQGFTFSRLDFK
ncbi:DUF927 domain-containing protein [Niallia oryzisoli]|uniref:DUF927 domain-containing protein n=1 Tax=Niallia oryzisoli TaxID=1737571 RepID=A0ABZ2CH62_9BACI